MCIKITGAKEKNLKNIDVNIPKNKFVVITGVSGSGKSSLAIDTLYQESQRQYLEAIGYQGIHRPAIDSIKNTSPAVIVDQKSANRNPRSSVGTQTAIYTELRMIYEKLGHRICPNCHKEIASSDSREDIEFHDHTFSVYMDCPYCNYRMDKLTRSHFSYNTKEGSCLTCQGTGKTLEIDWNQVLHDNLSLEDGAVDFWKHKYKDYQVQSFYKALDAFSIPYKKNKQVSNLHEDALLILKYGITYPAVKEKYKDLEFPKTVDKGRFDGLESYLLSRVKEKMEQVKQYFKQDICPDCHGEKLNELSRSVTVQEIRLPELSKKSLVELYDWINELGEVISEQEKRLVHDYLYDLQIKLKRIIKIGLGYLTLDQQMITLSGGEAQRIKLSATLDSDITGVLYIIDEPTVGLHPQDSEGMIAALKELKDKGNTVVVIEHSTDVMKAADYIIDMGPGAGKHGGYVVAQGTYNEILGQEHSVTGKYLNSEHNVKQEYRKATQGWFTVHHAKLHNLKDITISFPIGCFTSVSGVSGSGKSTLIFDLLAKQIDVTGIESFNQMIPIHQQQITRMKRSNVATYSGLLDDIRKLFANIDESKQRGYNSQYFSFNSKGRCEHCEGLGYVENNLLFFENITTVCPVCQGKQFKEEVLEIKLNEKSISDVLHLSIEEALSFFKQYPTIMKKLNLLSDVGLEYLELGQSLTTLSGGEGQRLKLASELMKSKHKKNLYLIDEPTMGLHPLDVEHFLVLLNRLVDEGNTVIVVEHSTQVINDSDWMIDLGPYGGAQGGEVIAQGTPKEIKRHSKSITGKYL